MARDGGALPEARLTIVVLSYNRREELRRTLRALLVLPERPSLVVVDNASSDGTAEMLAREFPQLDTVRCAANLGAAGRNAGVARVRTPYVAFCDDDTVWQPGALRRAADLLDAHPRVAALVARVQVGEPPRDDAICAQLAGSPLPAEGLPGPALLGLLAGASVMRAEAFRAVGGYWPPFFIGGEEALMAFDFAARGWAIVYAPELVTRHWPSPLRDRRARSWLLLRNAIWTAWLRLPVASAVAETARMLAEAARAGLFVKVLRESLRGVALVRAGRRVAPAPVLALRLALQREAQGRRAAEGKAIELEAAEPPC